MLIVKLASAKLHRPLLATETKSMATEVKRDKISGTKEPICASLVNLVGLAGFEPASIAPEATSLDQASRQPPSKFSVLPVLAFSVSQS